MAQTRKQRQPKSKSIKDIVLWSIIIVLTSAGVVTDHLLGDVNWSLRLAGWIFLACILVFLALLTTQGKQAYKFAKDSRIELRKVVWPKREVTVRTTFIVAGLVVLASLIMWGADSIFITIIGWLTGQRG